MDNYLIDDIYEESIGSSLGAAIRHAKDDFDVRKYWNNKNGKLKKKSFDSKRVSDKDFKTIVECFYNMKQSKKYDEYKKYFNKMCSICRIPTDQCIIQYYNLVKGKKPNRNEVCITYANTSQKIAIPADCELYHRSTNHKITELLPFFQGKAARGYLYSSPRIYLTIRKKMLMTAADLKPGTSTSLYKVKENIRTAYVDPLVPGYQFGAVYVDTRFPIKVEKVKSDNTTTESVDDNFPEDTPVFTSMEEFTDYYGLKLVDENEEDQVVEESIQAKIGIIERIHNDNKFLNKKWKKHRLKASDKEIIKELKPKEFTNVTNWYSIIKTTKDEKTYKKAFDKLCKVFSLKPVDICIKTIEFDNEDFMCRLVYSIGRQKFIIPNGYALIHKSSKDIVKELIPRLYQKYNGAYVYPTYRIYMQIVPVDKVRGHHTYIPQEQIRSVYLDTDATTFNKQYAYIETRFPIKVKPADEE